MTDTTRALLRTLGGLAVVATVAGGAHLAARGDQNCNDGCLSCNVWASGCDYCTTFQTYNGCAVYGEGCISMGCVCYSPGDECFVS